jgi:hypothetical protein
LVEVDIGAESELVEVKWELDYPVDTAPASVEERRLELEETPLPCPRNLKYFLHAIHSPAPIRAQPFNPQNLFSSSDTIYITLVLP